MEEKELKRFEEKLDAIISNTGNLERFMAMVEKHERMLRGGNGEGIGLMARVQNIERLVEESHLLLYGSEDKPGLKGKVNELVNDVAAYNKLSWVIITTTVGILISLLVTH